VLIVFYCNPVPNKEIPEKQEGQNGALDMQLNHTRPAESGYVQKFAKAKQRRRGAKAEKINSVNQTLQTWPDVTIVKTKRIQNRFCKNKPKTTE
jgi:hypothetical protein